MPLLFIYPEGTVTNGDAILDFKKGAFMFHKPIKIIGFKTSKTKRQYHHWNCWIPEGLSILL